MALDFGCPIFSELRAKNIFLLDSMNSLRKNRNDVEFDHLCIFIAIQNDSQLCFFASVFCSSSYRFAGKLVWECLFAGSPCITSANWGRNLIRYPPSVAELPNDSEQSFPDGTACFFCSLRL